MSLASPQGWSHNVLTPNYGKEQAKESEADGAGSLNLLDSMGKCAKITVFFLSHENQNLILDTSWVFHQFG